MSKAPSTRFRQAPDLFASCVWGVVVFFAVVEFAALFWLDIV